LHCGCNIPRRNQVELAEHSVSARKIHSFADSDWAIETSTVISTTLPGNLNGPDKMLEYEAQLRASAPNWSFFILGSRQDSFALIIRRNHSPPPSTAQKQRGHRPGNANFMFHLQKNHLK